jgi:NAD(P)-dependent dehydrogenase (short-subunit alcohol dehydrogenase family)
MDARGVAVVTGASRGIGRAVAIGLATAGFDVVATMRDPAAGAGLAARAGLAAGAGAGAGSGAGARSGAGAGTITVAPLDVTRPETVVLPEGLRVLVNNAGIERDYLPVEAAPMDQWREVFETNVFGLVEVTRRAIPIMRAGGGGVICNITSSSLLVSVPFYAVYRSSKAAVRAIGESLRAEVAPFGIRVIEVMPGPVESDMLTSSARLPEAAGCPGYEAMAEAMHEGRAAIADMITPADAAASAICDAILAEGGPLRWSCDDLGGQLISAWQADPEATAGAR